MKNQKGFIALDFLFAFILVMGFMGILFAFTLTLSVVEVTQYISFAAARNYSVAHVNDNERMDLASRKYTQLINNPAIKNLYNGGWFEISKSVQLDDFADEYDAEPNSKYLFHGARTGLTAKVLSFKIPFFGSTTNDESEGHGFKTQISSFVGKEPTSGECFNFSRQRWQWILQTQGANFNNPALQTNNYKNFADNGC